MSQEKINPATGYVHDDSQLEEQTEAQYEAQRDAEDAEYAAAEEAQASIDQPEHSEEKATE